MQRILLGTTQSVVSYPRVLRDDVMRLSGVPTSATARRVGQVSRDPETAYVAATIDTLTTTTQGAHQEGDESITLAGAVAIVAGRRYLITDAVHGRSLVVEATKTGSSAELFLAEPLLADVANASTVRGLEVSVALTASQTSEPGPGYVLFRATVDGILTEWDEAFRVVRRITSIALTTTTLQHLYPVVRRLASSTDTTLEESIGAAWQAMVQPWLAAIGILDEDVITDDVLIPVHAAAVVLHLANQWPAADVAFVERLQASYEQTKQTTKDRVDLAIRSQLETTPDPPSPNNEPKQQIRVTR
jgi:hypothetical protein